MVFFSVAALSTNTGTEWTVAAFTFPGILTKCGQNLVTGAGYGGVRKPAFRLGSKLANAFASVRVVYR